MWRAVNLALKKYGGEAVYIPLVAYAQLDLGALRGLWFEHFLQLSAQLRSIFVAVNCDSVLRGGIEQFALTVGCNRNRAVLLARKFATIDLEPCHVHLAGDFGRSPRLEKPNEPEWAVDEPHQSCGARYGAHTHFSRLTENQQTRSSEKGLLQSN
jgi:hypothetical protein